MKEREREREKERNIQIEREKRVEINREIERKILFHAYYLFIPFLTGFR